MKIKLDNVKENDNVVKFEEFCLRYQEKRDKAERKKKEMREVKEYRQMRKE